MAQLVPPQDSRIVDLRPKARLLCAHEHRDEWPEPMAIPRQPVAQVERHRQHPLPDGNIRDHAHDEQTPRFLNANGTARSCPHSS